jgi:hypothetical protein
VRLEGSGHIRFIYLLAVSLTTSVAHSAPIPSILVNDWKWSCRGNCLKGLMKTTKTQVRVAGLRAKISHTGPPATKLYNSVFCYVNMYLVHLTFSAPLKTGGVTRKYSHQCKMFLCMIGPSQLQGKRFKFAFRRLRHRTARFTGVSRITSSPLGYVTT